MAVTSQCMWFLCQGLGSMTTETESPRTRTLRFWIIQTQQEVVVYLCHTLHTVTRTQNYERKVLNTHCKKHQKDFHLFAF